VQKGMRLMSLAAEPAVQAVFAQGTIIELGSVPLKNGVGRFATVARKATGYEVG